MTGKGCVARRRARENQKSREIDIARLETAARWYKASDVGIELGLCSWRGSHRWRDEQDCREQAKWIMETEKRRWSFCLRHTAQIHAEPWRFTAFAGRSTP
jgi:hypothetical protein